MSSAGSEHDHQAALIKWWQLSHRSLGLKECALFAIPNGGLRNKAVAGKLKAEGVRAGIPDLFLAVTKVYPHYDSFAFRGGLFIEMKSSKGRQSSEQLAVAAVLSSQYEYVVVRDWTDGMRAIRRYLNTGSPDEPV